MTHPSFFDELGQLVMRILQSVAPSDHILFSGAPNSQRLDCDGLRLSDTMGTLEDRSSEWNQALVKDDGNDLDRLTFNVGLPNRLAEYNPRRRHEIPEYCHVSSAHRRKDTTHNPRAPCLSSIKNTLYVSEVSKVKTSCSLCLGGI